MYTLTLHETYIQGRNSIRGVPDLYT